MRILQATFICLMLATCSVQAQHSGNLRSHIIVLTSDSIQLDSSTIIRGTLTLSDGTRMYTEPADYRVDYIRSVLHAGENIPRNTPLQVRYKVLLLDLRKPFAHKNSSMIRQEYIEKKNPFLYVPGSQGDEELFRSEGLKMNGSLSRGLSFGNNQDVVLNSNLNLQIAGKLNNDVDVLAAVSDENNPIQPEGNTQQLQDFDKVFIQLSKGRSKLVVGDFEMTRPRESYFMNYFKKSRGAQFYSGVVTGKRSELTFGGEGAVSRGRFARNVINGIEGNQGPYRLSGQNGELFIIIISGTEAVYLDGERLTRGEQNDYVIDYNTGEVTFMARRLITQYSRIIVEFQYSDRNYGRAVFHFNTEYAQKDAFRIRANYFLEQDNKSQPLLQNLTDSNKLLLSSVGDRLNEALAPSANRTTTFNKSRIQYRKIDTAGYRDVYLYTDDPASDTVFYEVRFSLVGQGKGNYVQSQTAANGRVFSWVQPRDGVKQGDYEPVIQLISPRRLQMYSLGVDVAAIRNTMVSVEVAQSNYDKNLFADFDKGDDVGTGVKVSATNVLPLEGKKEDFWNLRTDASYEHVDKQFRYVERYRNVEFDRTWNRQLTNPNVQDTGFEENIVYTRASLNRQSIGSVYYQLGLYDRASLFNGTQHYAGTNLRLGRNIVITEAEWIRTRDRTSALSLTNEVDRYRAEYAREVLAHIVGFRYDYERSSFTRTSDSLLNPSFRFNQSTVYIKNTDSTRLAYRVEYSQREDYLPRGTEYGNTTLGRNVLGSLTWLQQNNNRLSLNFAYRDLIVKDTNLIKTKPEKTVLARVEYDYGFLKRMFTANTYYQLGSGQELRRDYQFVEVPTGQGTYVWKDFNGDGKQQLNEFVNASFVERNQANYIKVFLATTSMIVTNSAQFNQTLNINPGAIWSNRSGFLKVLSHFNNQTGLKIDRKTSELSTLDFINPFQLDVRDSQLISLSSIVRNTIFFNRSDPTFGADYGVQDSRSKNYLTNGFDSRARREHTVNARWNFTRTWGTSVTWMSGYRSYLSDFFATGNFRYDFYEVKPRLIYQYNQSFRATLLFSYFEGVNAAEFSGQRGTNRETGIELRYNATNSGVISARYSYYIVSFSGDIASPVGYDMLNGFLEGENHLWNLNFQQRLGSNLQVNVNYDGRKSQDSDIIHIGRVEARYLF